MVISPFIINSPIILSILFMICIVLVIIGAMALSIFRDETNYDIYAIIPPEISQTTSDKKTEPIIIEIQKNIPAPIIDNQSIIAIYNKEINTLLDKIESQNIEIFTKLMTKKNKIIDKSKNEKETIEQLESLKGLILEYLEKYRISVEKYLNKHEIKLKEYEESGVNVGEEKKLLAIAFDELRQMNFNKSIDLAKQIKKRALGQYQGYMDCKGTIELTKENLELILDDNTQNIVAEKVKEISKIVDYSIARKQLIILQVEMNDIVQAQNQEIDTRLMNCSEKLIVMKTKGISESEYLIEQIAELRNLLDNNETKDVFTRLPQIENEISKINQQYETRKQLIQEIQKIYNERENFALEYGDIKEKIKKVLAQNINDCISGLISIKDNILEIQRKNDELSNLMLQIQNQISDVKLFEIDVSEFESTYAEILIEDNFESAISLSNELIKSIRVEYDRQIINLKNDLFETRNNILLLYNEGIKIEDIKNYSDTASVFFNSGHYADAIGNIRKAKSGINRLLSIKGKFKEMIQEIQIQLNAADEIKVSTQEYRTELNVLSKSIEYERDMEKLTLLLTNVTRLFDSQKFSLEERINLSHKKVNKMLGEGITEANSFIVNISEAEESFKSKKFFMTKQILDSLDTNCNNVENLVVKRKELIDNLKETHHQYVLMDINCGDIDQTLREAESGALVTSIDNLSKLKDELIKLKEQFDNSRTKIINAKTFIEELTNYNLDTTELDKQYLEIKSLSDYELASILSDELINECHKKKSEYIQTLQAEITRIHEYILKLENENTVLANAKDLYNLSVKCYKNGKYLESYDNLTASKSVIDTQLSLKSLITNLITEASQKLFWIKHVEKAPIFYKMLENFKLSKDYSKTKLELEQLLIEINTSVVLSKDDIENRLSQIKEFMETHRSQVNFELISIPNQLAKAQEKYDSNDYPFALEIINNIEKECNEYEKKESLRSTLVTEIQKMYNDNVEYSIVCQSYNTIMHKAMELKIDESIATIEKLKNELIEEKSMYDSSRELLASIKSKINMFFSYGMNTHAYEALYDEMLEIHDYKKVIKPAKELLRVIQESGDSYINMLEENIQKVENYVSTLEKDEVNVSESKEVLIKVHDIFKSQIYAEVLPHLKTARAKAVSQLTLRNQIVDSIKDIRSIIQIGSENGLELVMYNDRINALEHDKEYNKAINELMNIKLEIEKKYEEVGAQIKENLIALNNYLSALSNKGVIESNTLLEAIPDLHDAEHKKKYSFVMSEINKLENDGKELELKYNKKSELTKQANHLYLEHKEKGVQFGDIVAEAKQLKSLSIDESLSGLEKLISKIIDINEKYETSRTLLGLNFAEIQQLKQYGINTAELHEIYNSILSDSNYNQAIENANLLTIKIKDKKAYFINTVKVNISKLNDYILDYQKEGLNVDNGLTLIESANTLFASEKYENVATVLKEAYNFIEQQIEFRNQLKTIVKEVDNLIEFCEKAGLNVDNYMQILDNIRGSTKYTKSLEEIQNLKLEIGTQLETNKKSILSHITSCKDSLDQIKRRGINEIAAMNKELVRAVSLFEVGQLSQSLDIILRIKDESKNICTLYDKKEEQIREISTLYSTFESSGIYYERFNEKLDQISRMEINDSLLKLKEFKDNIQQVKNKFEESRSLLGQIEGTIVNLKELELEVSQEYQDYIVIGKETDYNAACVKCNSLLDILNAKRASFVNVLNNNLSRVSDYVADLDRDGINVSESTKLIKEAKHSYESGEFSNTMVKLRIAHKLAEEQLELRSKVKARTYEINQQLENVKRSGLSIDQYSIQLKKTSESSDYKPMLEELALLHKSIDSFFTEFVLSVEEQMKICDGMLDKLKEQNIIEMNLIINKGNESIIQFNNGYYSLALETTKAIITEIDELSKLYLEKNKLLSDIESKFEILKKGDISIDNTINQFKTALAYPIHPSLEHLQLINMDLESTIITNELDNKNRYDKLITELVALKAVGIYNQDIMDETKKIQNNMIKRLFKIVNDQCTQIENKIELRKNDYNSLQKTIIEGNGLLKASKNLLMENKDLELALIQSQDNTDYKRSIQILQSEITTAQKRIYEKENEYYEIITFIESESNLLQHNYGITSQRINKYISNLRAVYKQKKYSQIEEFAQKVRNEIEEEKKLRNEFIETHVNHKCQCGKKNETSSLFCSSCGGSVIEVDSEGIAIGASKICPYCTSQYEESSRFCETCGNELRLIDTPKELPAPEPIVKGLTRPLPPPPRDETIPMPSQSPPYSGAPIMPPQYAPQDIIQQFIITDVNGYNSKEIIDSDHQYGRLDFSGWVTEQQLACVSRKHIRLVKQNNILLIEHLSASNTTQVNGVFLPPGELHEIKPGDIIDIAQGNLILRVGIRI